MLDTVVVTGTIIGVCPSVGVTTKLAVYVPGGKDDGSIFTLMSTGWLTEVCAVVSTYPIEPDVGDGISQEAVAPTLNSVSGDVLDIVNL